jgi:hypothetical protein
MEFTSQPHLSRDAPDYQVSVWRRSGATGSWHAWKANMNKTPTGCAQEGFKTVRGAYFLIEEGMKRNYPSTHCDCNATEMCSQGSLWLFSVFKMKSDFGSCPAPLCRFCPSRVGLGSLYSSSFSPLLRGNLWRTARRSFQNLPRLLRIAHGKDNQLFLRTCLCPGVAVVDIDACVSKLPGSFGQCSGLIG